MIDGIFTLDDDDKKKDFYKMLKKSYHAFKFNWKIITIFEEKKSNDHFLGCLIFPWTCRLGTHI
jgi:hypothetical protein